MNYAIRLEVDGAGDLWLTECGETHPKKVCTVLTACKLLRRSRRQVYRQLRRGTLRKCSKFLGELLVDIESVEKLSQTPLTKQPIPKGLQRLFPEYRVVNLNVGRDRALIVGRILESGTIKELRWLFRRYTNKEVRSLVESNGQRTLSPRALRLWSLVLKVRPKRQVPWRDSVEGTPWQNRGRVAQ